MRRRLAHMERWIREAGADMVFALLMARTGGHRGRRPFGAEELRLLYRAVASQNLFGVGGRMVSALEKEFAMAYGVPYAVASTSGTAALHVALGALDLNPGDEVITTPITDLGTIIPILYQGGVPVFADVNETYNIDPADIERKITVETRAIIAVHLFGNPCDMDVILAIGRRHGIPVIEDCSQAHMTRYKGRFVGTIGDIGCFSFQQSKHMTTGDGGMTITSNAAYWERMRLFVDKGYARGGWGARAYLFHAPNYRMTELVGAVGLAQLKKVRRVVEKRMALGAYLNGLLGAIPGVFPAPLTPESEHAYWVYPFSVSGADRDHLARALANEKIPVVPGYIGKPIYLCSESLASKKTFGTSQWPFTAKPGRNYEYREGLCPRAEEALDHLICVIWDESWTKRDVERVARIVERTLGSSPLAAAGSTMKPRTALPEPQTPISALGKVRIGIVGCGQIGRWHLRAYARHPEAQVVAVADVDLERARRMAAEVGARVYRSHTELLASEALDGASVCTVPSTHRGIAVDLLEAGVHVLCEKPLALTVTEAREMLNAARAASRQLVPAFKFRFHDEVKSAKQILATGSLGRILTFRMMFGGQLDMAGTWYVRPEVSGGGVVMDNGPHAIDLIRHLLGEIGEITAEATDSQSYGVEDTGKLIVHLESGTVGTVDLSWAMAVPSRAYLEIFGEHGTLLADLEGVTYKYRTWPDWKRLPNRTGVEDAFARQAGHFLDAIKQPSRAIVTPEDGMKSQILIESAYETIRQRRPAEARAKVGSAT